MDDDDITSVPIDAPVKDVDMDDDDPEDVVGVEKDITGDGGVKKKILVKGKGWQNPEVGDKVDVHYVGTLEDGSQFDSSRDRGEPFNFELGVGKVIKAWDRGVQSMKKGEKAILTCRGDYAYGEQGSPPKIPPNATLHFEVELLGWKNSKDISPDNSGGIIKTIVKEGVEWSHPSSRDEVLVTYTVRVEGSQDIISSSSEGGEEFVLGAGHLVPALPIALETMKKQEQVTLLVRPEFGFGAAGKADAVAPNATLIIDLELLSWKKVEDVTDNGEVVKKTLQEGKETWKKPNEGATVTLRYTGRLPDGTVFEEHDARTTCLEDGELPKGLELAIGKMHLGERALVTVASPSYAYGEAGRSEGLLAPVPPSSGVAYEVELTSMQNSKEMWELRDDAEKLSTSLAVKEKGNTAFKAGHNERAVKLYKRAIKFVEVDKTKTVTDSLRQEFKDARKSGLLNLAAAQIKLSDFKEAISSCEKVLELDSGSIKALYRLAQAHMNFGDYVEAEQAIKRGLQIEERNADLLALQKKLKVLAREQNQRESKMFAKMFAPSKASHTPAPTPAAPAPEPEAAPEVSAPAAVDVVDTATSAAAEAVPEAAAAPEADAVLEDSAAEGAAAEAPEVVVETVISAETA